MSWTFYNNNPVGRRVGDCAVRAISKALDVSWETAYAMIASNGFAMGDMPSSNSVWGAVLRQNGFYREAVPDSCPDCYTAEDFCKDHPKGTYVLGFGTHMATAHTDHMRAVCPIVVAAMALLMQEAEEPVQDATAWADTQVRQDIHEMRI